MPTMLRKRFILALMSTVLIVAILEITGRVTVKTEAPRHDGFVADPVLGWKLPSNTVINWRGIPASINSLGLRSPAPLAQANTRILFVGDSSVFGDGVRDDQTMVSQTAKALQGKPGVDVQNAGIPGYTCPQTKILLSRIRPQFQPDILVVYNMHSDFRKAAPHDRVIAATQLGMFANTGIGKLISQGILTRRVKNKSSNLTLDEYTDCITDLADSQKGNGGHTIFLVPISEPDFPNSPFFGQPDPEPPGERLSDYRDAMKAVGAATNSPVVDGPAVTVAAGLTSGTALLDPVHPTPKGHQVMARHVAESIQASGWVGTTTPAR
jgi:lysophospholipase L1-like esterase